MLSILTDRNTAEVGPAFLIFGAAKTVTRGTTIVTGFKTFICNSITDLPRFAAFVATMHVTGKGTFIVYTDAIALANRITDLRIVNTAILGARLVLITSGFACLGNIRFLVDALAILAGLIGLTSIIAAIGAGCGIAGLRLLGRIIDTFTRVIAHLPGLAVASIARSSATSARVRVRVIVTPSEA